MSLRIQFFGRPSDVFGPGLNIEIPADGLPLSELRRILVESEPEASDLFERYLIRAAVDDVISAEDVIVRPGQTVEFFSLFSGG